MLTVWDRSLLNSATFVPDAIHTARNTYRLDIIKLLHYYTEKYQKVTNNIKQTEEYLKSRHSYQILVNLENIYICDRPKIVIKL